MHDHYYLRLIPARTVGVTFDRVHEISAPVGVVVVGRARIPQIVPVGAWRSGEEFDQRVVAAGLPCFWRPHLPGDESLPRARLGDLDCDPGTFVLVQEDAGTEAVIQGEQVESPAAAAPSTPPWRRPRELAGWPIEWRRRWAELANHFEEVEGVRFPESERLAFDQILAEKEGSRGKAKS
jgi:hypothetical protein